MYNYFKECTSQAEAKALYRELVRKHHPDAGGDTRTMQDINAEYALFQARGASADARRRQQDAHADNRKSAADFHDIDEVEGILKIMIEFALNLDGVEIELMGLWVWLTGNTKAHKEEFKAWNENHDTKWRWSPKKTAWYYAGVPSFNRKDTTLDEIRNTYGSQKFTHARREETAGVLTDDR